MAEKRRNSLDENATRLERRIESLEARTNILEGKMNVAEYWRIGNGSRENSADYRLTWLMNNVITRENIHQIVQDVVRQVMKQKRTEQRMDWNKWVNTGLLVLTAAMVILMYIGGS